MQINPIQLLEQGIYVEKATSQKQLRGLAAKLHPVRTQHELVRIGGENDGGYLLPDDFEDISACFSPGVADNASFEADLQRKTSIQSHLADYSVESAPKGFKPKTFTKKFLGCVNDNIHMTLESWMSRVEDLGSSEDALLQMDIEGGEYSTLLSCPSEVLCRFRIIVLEVHDIYAWGNVHFFKLVEGMFDRLLQYFYVVHNHPNNNDGAINLGGFVVPRTMELTLIRKDRAHNLGYLTQFPHSNDRPNVPHQLDVVLPEGWYFRADNNPYASAVLCRPQGGLNDILCCIERCWAYAEQHHRKLLIDCRQSGIRDDFWKYFELREHTSMVSQELNYKLFDNLTTLPANIQGRLSSLKADYSFTQSGFVDVASDTLLTFDMNLRHEASLLVHEQGWTGGVFSSAALLSRLRFTRLAKTYIKERLNALPKSYVGIHIRNTDYTTDYVSFIQSIKAELSERHVLICSDNLEVIEYVRSELVDAQVIRLSAFEDNGNARLHYRDLGSKQYVNNLETMVDLCALALSENVYFSNVREANRPSGFSMLANHLNKNKNIVHEMLAD